MPSQPSTPAELVVIGGRVLADGGASDAVAVDGDRVVALGSEDVRGLVGPGTRVVDAAGGLVLPGFQDAHVHAPFAGRNLLGVWLNDDVGKDAYLARIRAHADAHPQEAWVVGGGWAMEYFPGGTPSKEDLDAVVPDRPVFLFNRDVHGAWVNSRALELGGITRETPDPTDGRIERDASGEPTGTLHEGAAYTFNDTVVPRPAREDWERAVLAAQAHLHALGITGWQDAWVTPGTLEAYRSLAADGRLTARVVAALWWDRHRGLDQVGDLLAQRASALGESARLHPTSVKIMTDGVMENYTGALLEPYCDGCGGRTSNRGLSYLEHDELAAAVTALDGHGFQVHMHAIGDRAVRNALDAVEAARAANGPNDLRHHIAHVQLVHPEDVPRFARLDVTANLQAYWAQREPQMDELTIPYLGEDRARHQYPFRSLHDTGAALAMGSDWAVTTADPLEQIEVAATRTDPGNLAAGPFLPEQALPLEVAVRAFTAGSARVNHDPDGGRIALGSRADLAVLDADVLTDPRLRPTDATVTTTVVAGRVVHGGS